MPGRGLLRCLCVCVFVCLFVCLHVCLYVCLFVYLYLCVVCRLVLRCRQDARSRFAKMRSDVLVKLELLDNKHG